VIVVRVVVALLGAVASIVALCGSAAAFQYCPVSVGAIQPLQFAASDAYRRALDRRFGVELQSEERQPVSVELSIAANDAIYRVTFNDLAFSDGDAPAVFFAFDRPKAVDYLWVSRVIAAQSTLECPLDPFRASHEYFNDRKLAAAELTARLAANERLLKAAKAAPISHPQFSEPIHRDCPEPEQAPTLKHEVAPDGGDLSGLKGPTAIVALVHVSPGGEPLDVQMFQGSTFSRLNAAVLASAKASTYYPATIDCMPSTGIYLFKAIFGT